MIDGRGKSTTKSDSGKKMDRDSDQKGKREEKAKKAEKGTGQIESGPEKR